jgi:hypothetical protein
MCIWTVIGEMRKRKLLLSGCGLHSAIMDHKVGLQVVGQRVAEEIRVVANSSVETPQNEAGWKSSVHLT